LAKAVALMFRRAEAQVSRQMFPEILMPDCQIAGNRPLQHEFFGA
jgi:hypothetical protein